MASSVELDVPATANRGVMSVFAGLMLGMFVTSLNLTLVAPAMPVIVSELGGLDHYSWIALSSMLASTVVVPIVGKLSDLYGRKPFYMGGMLAFMLGSALAGLAPSFGFLVAARVLTGIGMGTIMPLSQAIIGDIIPPRERGKYQGLIGSVFGLASIVGPVLGSLITRHLSWRWLFFVNVPVGLMTLTAVSLFMRLPHEKRPHIIDLPGIATLTSALTCLLLATEMGGGTFPWGSPQIVGLYSLAALLFVLFVRLEQIAPEPVVPLALWVNPTFVRSNIAVMGVSTGMFGAIYFVPIFVQGVIGKSTTSSGTILVPLMLTMVTTSIAGGRLISATGRYKAMVLVGLICLGTGFWLLAQMDVHTPNLIVIRNLATIGIGIGLTSQTFVLIVQNSVTREELGVATATTQLFRSIGAAAGIALMGGLMTQGLRTALPRYLSPQLAATLALPKQVISAAALLDPHRAAHLPTAALVGIRAALAETLHAVYLAPLPFMIAALAVALFIPENPLRRTAHVSLRR